MVKLLQQLDAVTSESDYLLRIGCLNQLTALSHHIGHRAELIPSIDAVCAKLNSSEDCAEPWDNPSISSFDFHGFRC